MNKSEKNPYTNVHNMPWISVQAILNHNVNIKTVEYKKNTEVS